MSKPQVPNFEGKRIYCAVAHTIHTHWGYGDEGEFKFYPESIVAVQPDGRMVAQVAHAVSKVKLGLLARLYNENCGPSPEIWEAVNRPITTIVLSARDNVELHHIARLLLHAKRKHATFMDTNDAAYGEDVSVLTAIATEPLEPIQVVGILDYLPLWRP